MAHGYWKNETLLIRAHIQGFFLCGLHFPFCVFGLFRIKLHKRRGGINSWRNGGQGKERGKNTHTYASFFVIVFFVLWRVPHNLTHTHTDKEWPFLVEMFVKCRLFLVQLKIKRYGERTTKMEFSKRTTRETGDSGRGKYRFFLHNKWSFAAAPAYNDYY